MKVHFRPSLLNRVKGSTFGKSPSGSNTRGSPFQTVRIVSSQLFYFNSKSKPSDVAQWEKTAKDELRLSKTGTALELAGSDGTAVEGIAIQPDGNMPDTHGITSAEEVITYGDPRSTIDSQINCAKVQLNYFVKQLQKNDEIFSSKYPVIQEIASRLAGGMVPPLFHALGMPVEWLGGKTLCFSLDPVEAGNVEKESNLHLKIDALNKKEIVSHDLKAVECIVEGGGVSWDFDEIRTAWAVKLVNTYAQMRGANVESTNVGDLPSLIRDSREQRLLTRPQSRGVVATIFHRISSVRAETTTAITGLPGIGKSWTLLYVLQQALLYEGVFIMFFTDRSDTYLFHRRSGKLYAWRNKQGAKSDFLKSEETLAILNPPPKDGLNIPVGMRHLIYAASNHEKNFDEREIKSFPDMQHYVGPWTEDEIKAAFDDFNKDEGLLLSNILERFNRVGGLPRYLMRNAAFKRRLTQIVKSLKELKSFQDLEKSMRNARDEIDVVSDTVSGSLYCVVPRRNMDFDYDDYEGKCFFYQDPVVNWASQAVFLFVVNKFRKEALTYVGKTDDHEFIELGKAAEYWFHRDLQHGGLTFECWSMEGKSDDALNLEIPWRPKELRPQTASETYQSLAKLFAEPSNNDTFIVCPRNFPTVDAIGFGRRVFQVTVSKSHTLKLDGLKKILVSAGILASNGQDIIMGAEKINFYWVVLPGIVSHWTNRARVNLKDDREAVGTIMNEYVKQFVLKLPEESKWDENTDSIEKLFLPKRK